MSMAARYDNDIVVGGNFELPYAVFKAVAQHLRSIGEASLICKRRPVIAHIHFKSAFCRKLTHRQRNVTGSEHDKALGRRERLAGDTVSVSTFFKRDVGKAAAAHIRMRCKRCKRFSHALGHYAPRAFKLGFQRECFIVFDSFQNFCIDVIHRSSSSV